MVEIFPNPAAFLRLAAAVVIESHDEWQVTPLLRLRCEHGRDVIAAKKRAAAHEATTESLTPELETA